MRISNEIYKLAKVIDEGLPGDDSLPLSKKHCERSRGGAFMVMTTSCQLFR